MRGTRNTQIRRNESKHLSVSKWKSLKTGFPTPFLRSWMLRTCERTSRAGTMKAPVPSLSGIRTLSFAAKLSHCNTSQETPGTHRSGATIVNKCPLPKGASLNTGYPTPFFRSLMLRTCERASSAGTINAPSSSPSLFGQNSPQRRELLSDLSVFK